MLLLCSAPPPGRLLSFSFCPCHPDYLEAAPKPCRNSSAAQGEVSRLEWREGREKEASLLLCNSCQHQKEGRRNEKQFPVAWLDHRPPCSSFNSVMFQGLIGMPIWPPGSLFSSFSVCSVLLNVGAVLSTVPASYKAL